MATYRTVEKNGFTFYLHHGIGWAWGHAWEDASGVTFRPEDYDFETDVNFEAFIEAFKWACNEWLDSQIRFERDEMIEQLKAHAPADIKPRPPRPGYVYIIRGENGFYKIGRTNNPSQRIERLEVVLPFPIKAEMIIESNDMSSLEKELHERFAHRKANGEWFSLTTQDLAALREEFHD